MADTFLTHSLSYLRPLRVGRKGDEQVRLPQLADHSHTIMVQLVHEPRPSNKAAWKDDPTPDLVQAITLLHVLHHLLVYIGTNGVPHSLHIYVYSQLYPQLWRH